MSTKRAKTTRRGAFSSSRSAKRSGREIRKIASALEIDLPKRKLSKAVKERLAELLMHDWQINTADAQKTADELAPFTRAGAQIGLYRPGVRNVFALEPGHRATRPNSVLPSSTRAG